ncbi:hypothetical protein PanWU01x14_237380 [Parasponia andersonii]|uniref:Uncharacterized protein n=1 Tax=Parasponia andersonii TaxID=3476 RepID=A0A2P5BI19_PARAD|nr:hypothetical protein PanWU01x14_237380 [Parasponia andersonii]
MINWSTDIKALYHDLEREVFQSKEIEMRKVTPTDEEKKMLNLSEFCYNSKDSVVRNLAEENDDFDIPAQNFPLSTEPYISKLTKPSSSKSAKSSISKSSETSTSRAKKASENAFKPSLLYLKNYMKLLLLELSQLTDIHTNDNAKRIEEDELGIDDQTSKVNENERKDNDGRDSKSAAATDSNAKGYTEEKDTDGENYIEIVVNKDKGSDIVQGVGGKLNVIDDQG